MSDTKARTRPPLTQAEVAKLTTDPSLPLIWYLGRKGLMHFLGYVHGRANTMHPAELGAQVYNCMIHETMIRKDDNIMVLRFDGSKVLPSQVTHAEMAHVDMRGVDIPKLCKALLEADRKQQDILTITGSVTPAIPMLVREIPGTHQAAELLRQQFASLAQVDYEAEPTQHAVTMKSIDYLNE